jgi:predicted dehydrogenase
MKRVQVAVVGAGYWGPNLVRVLHELSTTEVPYVCDLRRGSLNQLRARYPGAQYTTQLAQVLHDERVDAVAIATPVSTHHKLAAAALEAGKHVFVEKPLADSSARARDLAALAAERELVLMPGHTFLYSPPVNLIRKLIRSGDLGTIYFISISRVNLGIHQSDVSVAWDLGPHDFSILRYWLEEAPAQVMATGRSCVVEGIPDVAFINLRYGSGAIAHVELSWLAPSKLRRTAIVGSKKMVVYDDTSTEPVRIFDAGVNSVEPQSFGEYRLTYRTGNIISPPVDVTEPLLIEMRDFVRAIRTGRPPRSSAEIGIDVVRTIEAVDESFDGAGAAVEVDESISTAVVTPQRPARNGSGQNGGGGKARAGAVVTKEAPAR